MTTTKIKVTVIVPVYNQERLVIRALDSIPVRDDIEVIVIDDGSIDDTWSNLLGYRERTNLNLVLLYNKHNEGVASAMNKGYDNASGEYVVALGSDDYFYPDRLVKIMEMLDGTDMVYFNLEVNGGSIWAVNEKTKRDLCGSVKFIRRAFLGDTRCPNRVIGEDLALNEELLLKNPSERFTNMVIKHYNYPRKGSLTDLYLKKG